jgi:hypothetical protein
MQNYYCDHRNSDSARQALANDSSTNTLSSFKSSTLAVNSSAENKEWDNIVFDPFKTFQFWFILSQLDA